MKIGFSFGRCVRSIALGEVKTEDVLCIIARTLMSNEEHVREVVEDYVSHGTLRGLDLETCTAIGLDLFTSGKILEPRANGVRPMSVPNDYIWMDLFPTIHDPRNDGVRQAWEHYRMLITLSEQLPEEYVPVHSQREKAMTEEEWAEHRRLIDMLANSI